MRKNVLFGWSNPRFGFPYIFYQDLSQAFSEFGIGTSQFPVARTDDLLDELKRRHGIFCTFLINFSAAKHAEFASGHGIFERNLCWQQDNPYIMPQRVYSNVKNQQWLCADSGVLPHSELFYGKGQKAVHFPHWATYFSLDRYSVEEVAFESRPFDVLFVGSINEALMVKAYDSIKDLPAPWADFTTALLGRVLENSTLSIYDHALQVQAEFSLELDRVNRFREFINWCIGLQIVDSIVRQKRRIEFFEKLELSEKIRLAVASSSIDVIKKYYGGKFTSIPNPDVVTGLRMMENSRIVINNLPMYTGGATERLFNAQLRGAAVLSESNDFLKREFDDDRSIFLYLPESDLDQLSSRIEDVLASAELKQVAERGRLHTENNHTARNRVQFLVDNGFMNG